MPRVRRGESGFTMMEIMVSLVVMVIGMLGIMALQSAAVRGNRTSRQLERARVVAAEVMEQARGLPVANPPTVAPITSADGVTFVPSIVVEDIVDHPLLKRVTVTVTFAEDGDDTQTRGATLELIRTTEESL
jgi:prepilin-type N-terminal cleavage/methylation domain-containing protein